MSATEKIDTKSATIWIDGEGILHMKLKPQAEVDLKEVESHFKIYEELGLKKNKALQLFEGGSFFTFDSEAMKFVSKNGSDYFIATAIVNNSLAIRILFGFFKRFFHQAFPCDLFDSKAEALKWLKTFKKT